MSNDLVTTSSTTEVDRATELSKTKLALTTLSLYEMDIVEQGRILTLSKPILKADRVIMTDRHHAIASSLRGCGLSVAHRDRAGLAVSRMFEEGWPLYKIDNPIQVGAAYLNAMANYPVWAVESACMALSKGLVEDVRPEFPPTAARCSQLCEGKIAELSAERRRYLRVLSIKDMRAAPMTEEERLAGLKKYQDWKEQIKANPDPLTEAEIALREKQTRETIEATRRQHLMEYKTRGLQPHYASDGTLISHELVAKLGLRRVAPKAEMD